MKTGNRGLQTMEINVKKIAVILPGIGYHKDKPLLYYGIRIASNMGYEIHCMEYHDMPQKIKGDAQMMQKAAEMAYEQTCAQLEEIKFDEYDNILFISKSIGTVVSAKYVAEHKLNAGQIWYTPVEATLSFGAKDVVSFIGEKDPWSDVKTVINIAKEQGIVLYSYSDCNHSLECDDVDRNIEILGDVMKKTREYISLIRGQ